ncbi:MAG: 3-phosphoshikimate 1-carboxyvinyltransferase, partial [Pseudomonadota bacterium]
LLMGLVGGAGVTATFTGDGSLRRRPMDRVLTPLRQMGVEAIATHRGGLPLTLRGAHSPSPLRYEMPTASAQVKSAILLAGLGAEGATEIHEPRPSRDHTEKMLKALGADLQIEESADGGRTIRLTGGARLKARDVAVPSDPSSAAFPLVAALIAPGSDVVVENVLVNPLRAGLFQTLQEMGAQLTFENQRTSGGEEIADIRAQTSPLKAGAPPAARAPSMIDEYPILSVAAAFADGETVLGGVGELRHKETDRIAAMCEGLAQCGVATEQGEDWMRVRGRGAPPQGGGRIDAQEDHRIAMSFLVLGLSAQTPVTVDGAETIATSFPSFFETMERLGARFAKPSDGASA